MNAKRREALSTDGSRFFTAESVGEKREIGPSTSGRAPGPRGIPLLGVLPHMWMGAHRFFLRSALQHGDVVQLGRPDRFLVSHPDAIRQVLFERHENYVKGKYFDRLRPLIGNGLPVSDGDFWRRQRRLMQPAFHAKRLASMSTTVTDCAAAMLARWQSRSLDGPIDILKEMQRLTLELMVKLMFGEDIAADEAHAAARSFSYMLGYIDSRTSMLFNLPEAWPLPAQLRFRRARTTVDQIVARFVTQHRSKSDDRFDLISMLLSACDADTGQAMTPEQLQDEIRTILVAGFHTTSLAISWSLYFLAQNPSVELRVHQEALEVFDGGSSALSGLDYTKMVLEESMRFYPPAWVTARLVVVDDEVQGYRIPAGSKVMISPYVTHHLPQFWRDPETFDPERFAPENSAARSRFAYLPFGAGPRTCIGMGLTMLEAPLVIAMVSRSFRLSLLPGQNVKPRSGNFLGPGKSLPLLATAWAQSPKTIPLRQGMHP